MKELLSVALLIVAYFAADLAPAGASKDTSDKTSEEIVKQDLQQVQGAWVRTERAGLFGTRKITKVIEGDRETVTYYDSNGGVERAHMVRISLRRGGPVRIFGFSDQVITAGPEQGKKT